MVLTRREKQLVEQLAQGHSNKEIAFNLGLSTGTVKCYLSALKKKDPESANRYSAVKDLLRDHQRVQAIRLDRWIQQWGENLPEEARREVRAICAEQVAEILK
jgi:IS30 family transposase